MALKIELTGKRVGRLTVLSFSHSEPESCGKKVRYYNVRCDCGTVRKMSTKTLLRKNAILELSCGCSFREHAVKRAKKHGCHKSRSYLSWYSMIERCTDVRHKSYSHYGGRGIGIEDPRWLSVENFVADMGERPPKHTLERIDVERGYCKENCRWATKAEQTRNQRRNKKITFNGIEKTQAEWSRELGLSSTGIAKRLAIGWSIERALTETPSQRHKTNLGGRAS